MANRCKETVETVTDFIFLGSRITAEGDCSQEIKRWLFLGRKVVINLDNTLKWPCLPWAIKEQIDYFANKGPSSQSYGFTSSHIWLCVVP